MIRKIILFSFILGLLFCLTISVSADEITNEVGIELLDYDTVNGSGSNFFAFNNNIKLSLTPPTQVTCTYIDIILQSLSGPYPTRASVWRFDQEFPLTIEPIADGFFRIYGSMRFDAYKSVSLSFYTDSDSRSYWELFSVHVSTYDTHFTTPAHANGAYGFGGQLTEFGIAADPSDPRPRHINIDASSYPNATNIWFDVTFPDWKKYDYLDLVLSFRGTSINSIAAYFEDYKLALDSSVVIANDDGTSYFLVTCRLDLRGLNKSSTMQPSIRFTGELLPDGLSYLQIMTASGFLQYSRSPLFYYFTQLRNNLSSWFNSLNNTVGTGFGNLNGWIDKQTQSIVSAISGDTTPGDQFQNEVTQKDQQLNDMAAIMDSISKPSLDDFDVSLDDYVNDSDIQVLATPINVLLEAELFSRIIFIALILATVSFVLYGKR